MLHEESTKKREQISLVCLDELVPNDHLLKRIERVMDWQFIYDLVREKYSPDFGRPSVDPVVLIKIPLIQYLYGIRSMRQTIREIEVNLAYRWFLGLNIAEKVPHFSTFGKNYTRRFKDTDLFEQIFAHILEECVKAKLVDPSDVFIDSTHVKACANNKKLVRKAVREEALFYEKQLEEEIASDREAHGKKLLKEKNDHSDDDTLGGNSAGKKKEVKASTTDPESGWFHKGEHKQVFAYSIETACDRHGWILGFTVHPGNQHDSRTFPAIYERIKSPALRTVIADAGYKTPAIAKLLLDDGVKPLFPYKCPMTKDGFFRKYEYAYDEYYDCYICPNNKVLKYSTTNRDGYREYKSNCYDCKECPYIHQCTESQNHVKVITRHVWESYMEQAEDIRHTLGMKELYNRRKETIERLFGTAKEHHNFRYTTMRGQRRMVMKTALTFACLNLKKLAKLRGYSPHIYRYFARFLAFTSKVASAFAC